MHGRRSDGGRGACSAPGDLLPLFGQARAALQPDELTVARARRTFLTQIAEERRHAPRSEAS